MIIGIGTDIVEISRIESMIVQYGDRFRARILHDEELADKGSERASFLAKRFAAKEAVSKALGTGMRGIVTWKHMMIRHDDRGCPYVQCVGPLEEWIRGRGITLHISLTDERAFAGATVVAEQLTP